MSKTKQQLAAELRSLKAVLAGETRQVQRLQAEVCAARDARNILSADVEKWYNDCQDLQQKLLALMDENQSLKRPWYKRFFT